MLKECSEDDPQGDHRMNTGGSEGDHRATTCGHSVVTLQGAYRELTKPVALAQDSVCVCPCDTFQHTAPPSPFTETSPMSQPSGDRGRQEVWGGRHRT